MSFQAYIDTIRAKTGKGPEDFRVLAEQKGLIGAKAGVFAAWLKQDFDLGSGHAMALWSLLKADGGPVFAPTEERLAKLFGGARAAWRETYESLLATAQSYGSDVDVSPADKYVSLTRGGRKFAVVQPGAKFLDLGFKRRGAPVSDRFASAAGWNDMLSHRTRLAAGEQPDAEILAWLRASYDVAG